MNSFSKFGAADFEVTADENVLEASLRAEYRFFQSDCDPLAAAALTEIATEQSGLPLRFRDEVPLLTQADRRQQRDLLIKRYIDVLVSALAMLTLLPLLAITGLLIKISSPGPIFFTQEREGLNGTPMRIFKLRTMHLGAGDPSGVRQTVKDDPRVFAFGRFLRKTSIDELPQLINVFRGDMSLVGPRPHVSHMRAAGMIYRDLVPYYSLRLAMKPGITGWAQANGFRGPTEDAGLARKRVDHDIAYIANFSLALDFKILVKTVKEEFLNGSGH